MARVSFENMPIDGPRDQRSLSRIVNGAMDGKINAVVDFTIPIGGLPFALQDIRISPQSYVNLMALNVPAATANVFYGVGDGVLNVDQVAPEFQDAIAQVSETGGSVVLNLITWTAIPYNVTDFDANWVVHPGDAGSVDNRIISSITGFVDGWFSINGVTSNNNPVIDVGLAHYDSSDVLKDRTAIHIVISGGLTIFNTSASFVFSDPVVPGDYFQLEALNNGSFSTYNAIWGLENKTGVDDASSNDNFALEYRAVIIG